MTRIQHALVCLKDSLVKTDYTQDDIQRIGLFFELIIKESIYKAEYSHLIIELLNFYKEEALRSYVIDVVEKLVTLGTKPYYCNKIIEITKKLDFCLDDKKRIIYSYLFNLTEHYFHTEDIIKLYNCIEWVDDVRGTELKNKLGQINPGFLLKLKNN